MHAPYSWHSDQVDVRDVAGNPWPEVAKIA
jgi:hypothetical protein